MADLPGALPPADLEAAARNHGAAWDEAYQLALIDRRRRHQLFLPDLHFNRLNALPAAMGSPPTITVSSANAATSITSATHRAANTLDLYRLGSGYTTASTRGGFTGGLTTSNLTSSLVPARAKFEWETDADVYEIVIWTTAASPNNKYRIMVDGAYVAAAPSSTGLGTQNALYRIKVDHGSRANRRIQFEADWCEFIGIAAHPVSTFWKPVRPVGPTVVWLGDSFTEGTGADWGWDGFAFVCGKLLGWNVIGQGVGGTGYLATGGGGGKVKFRDRVANDVTALAPDIVIVSGGYNDTGSSAAAVQAEAALLYAAIKSGNPNASLIVGSIHSPVGVTSTSIVTQIRDAQKTEAATAGAFFVDSVEYGNASISNPVSWFTGSGRVGATNGTGNSDYYTSSDAAHPSQAGHTYKGRRWASAVGELAIAAAA